MSPFLTGPEVIELLRRHAHGKQAALAFEAGVSEAFISRVMNGKAPPSDKLLRLIGCHAVTAYTREAA